MSAALLLDTSRHILQCGRMHTQPHARFAMYYLIYCHDVPNSLPLRQQARPAHLQRLQALRDAGCLLLAGPLPAVDAPDPGDAGFTGSVIIAEFASLSAAQSWAQADPYMAAGVYAHVDVRPFKRVLP
jgi:uncharacterized protein YciI